MGVRAFLALLVRAGTGMLDETAGGAETAVIMDGKRRDAATVVIRDQYKRPILIERNVARTRAPRRNLIQKLECASFRIDSKGAHRAAGSPIEIANLIHGVEIFTVGVHGQKGGIGCLCRNADGCELALLWIEPIRVNPLAVRF